MFKNSKKKITLGVSVQKFENKPNNWKILTYKRHTITIEELVNLICKGHCICQNFKTTSEIFEHKEKQKFIFENDKWYYYGMLPFPKQIKIKPNEPCPCGSGKIYKKCCGK